MKVRVLFFGATAEAAGRRETEISLGENAKAERAFAEVLGKYPQLKNHALLFAVNQEYASGDELISEGDELAIFTAVSGG